MRYMNSVFIALIPIAMGTATGAMAETETLTCRPGASINNALAKLAPGDVLQVRGVCTENVDIPPHVSDITLQGVNGAIIQGVDSTQAVISIRGRGIRVAGLTFTGGLEGVLIADGAFVLIDGNTIRANAGYGIQLVGNSTARIGNSLIENNQFGGIFVNSNSTALIGAFSPNDLVASPNTIRNNAGGGVGVTRSSVGRIVGNSITGNRGPGVYMARGSQADVAANNISANLGNGIEASQNSTLVLGGPAPLFTTPNWTDPAFPNAAFGVSCTGGGFITGRLGTLLGTSGTANVVDCSGGVAP
jgi:parallel beta-helix repeat protein